MEKLVCRLCAMFNLHLGTLWWGIWGGDVLEIQDLFLMLKEMSIEWQRNEEWHHIEGVVIFKDTHGHKTNKNK